MSIKYTILEIGYFGTKEIISTRDLFPTSITTPQEKKRNSTPLLPIVKRGIIIIIITIVGFQNGSSILVYILYINVTILVYTNVELVYIP
jgi:hypothetical protein